MVVSLLFLKVNTRDSGFVIPCFIWKYVHVSGENGLMCGGCPMRFATCFLCMPGFNLLTSS